jgi:hypothetical protein
MLKPELTARTILGPLNNTDVPFRDLLGDLLEREQSLSSGEKVTLDLARQFWNGQGEVTLGAALQSLDAQGKINLHAAVSIATGQITLEDV